MSCLPSIYRRTRLDFLILDTTMFLLVVVVVVLRLILLSFLVWTMYVFIKLFGGFLEIEMDYRAINYFCYPISMAVLSRVNVS